MLALVPLLSMTRAAPAQAESMPGAVFHITGEIVAKHDRWVSVMVASTERLDAAMDAPAPGDAINVRVGFGARFLKIGTTYSMDVFLHDGAFTSPIENVRHADGSPIDTGLLRRREFQVALAIAGALLIGLASYTVVRVRHLRRPTWRS